MTHIHETARITLCFMLLSLAATPSVESREYPSARHAEAANVGSAPLRSARLLLCSDPPCTRITTTLYGIDRGSTLEAFVFETGAAMSVVLPGDSASGADGLALRGPDDAFWVNGLGLDLITEIDPTDGSIIAGAFPIASPGTAGATDGLAVVDDGRLFSLNFADDALYEIDIATGAVVNDLVVDSGAIGALAGGVGRLFVVLDFTTITELDPDTGAVLGMFPAPDLDDDGSPDALLGLAFDGTHLFSASTGVSPPNIAALDPGSGHVIAVSPYLAPSGALSGLGAVASLCGDGRTSALEECDDGNTVSGDGCDANCTATGCGNGIVTADEECDDDGESSACDADCTAAACGDGLTNETSGERCDDGDVLDGNGCDGRCAVESCYTCAGAPSICEISAGAVCFVGGNSCETGVCSVDGNCTDAVVSADGDPCTDGLLCTVGDQCTVGACVPGPPRSCSHLDDTCALGRCSESTGGECVADSSQRDGQSCDDELFCTNGEICAIGICNGALRDCSDLDDACSVGECSETEGLCQAVTVLGPEQCEDANACTDDRCDPVDGCVNDDNTIACDDADPCTVVDQCFAGECRGELQGCEDGNDCTLDMCEPGFGCRHAAFESECTDLYRCTSDDECLLGVCTGGPVLGCERRCGDVTGEGAVTVTDAFSVLLLAALADDCDPAECDIDGNGRVSATDVLVLLRFIVGLELELSCPEPAEPIEAGPEIEPNDTLDDATPISCPSFETVGAEIGVVGDLDFYEFTASRGDLVAIDIDAQSRASNLDAVIAVLDNDGDILMLSDDDAAPGETFSSDSYLEFLAPFTDIYYVGVTSCCDFTFNGGPGFGAYVLSCTTLDVTTTTVGPTSTTTTLLASTTIR